MMKPRFLPAFFLLFASCVSTPHKYEIERGGWREDAESNRLFRVYKRVEDILLVSELGTRSPKLHFSALLLDTFDTALKTMFVKNLYDGMESMQYAEARYNAAKIRYLNSKPKGHTAFNASEFNWEYNELCTGYYYNNKPASVIVVDRTRYIIEGGANGINEREYFVFDLNQLRRVRLQEIITTRDIPKLNKAAAAVLARQYSKSSKKDDSVTLQSLGFFEDTVNIPEDNFFITPQGMGFSWNPYKIAPGSFGIIEAVLPYTDIVPFLTDSGRALFSAVHKK